MRLPIRQDEERKRKRKNTCLLENSNPDPQNWKTVPLSTRLPPQTLNYYAQEIYIPSL